MMELFDNFRIDLNTKMGGMQHKALLHTAERMSLFSQTMFGGINPHQTFCAQPIDVFTPHLNSRDIPLYSKGLNLKVCSSK